MSREEDLQTLSGLGITPSQGKVYLALLRLRASSRVHIIAKLADIPRQDVYRILDELQNLGIVQKTLVKPATFKAAPPLEAVNILINRKKIEFSLVEREANKFVQRAAQIFDEPQTELEKDQFFLITGREAITFKAMQMIENANVTFNDITPFSEFVPWLSVLYDSINKALNRGVNIHSIIDKPTHVNSFPKSLDTVIHHPNFSLRFIPSFPKVKMGIFDHDEVFLGLFTKSGFGLSPYLWSNNVSLSVIAESHFEGLWKKAIDMKLEVGKS